jgi:hypothetical protein
MIGASLGVDAFVGGGRKAHSEESVARNLARD